MCPWPTVVQPHILPVDLSWCRLWIFVDLMATFQGTLGHEFGRCSNIYIYDMAYDKSIQVGMNDDND